MKTKCNFLQGGKRLEEGYYRQELFATLDYYMAGSARGQFEANPVSWLATRASTMGLSSLLRIARFDAA